MRLEPRSISDAIELGYHAGNLHWRVRFQGEVLFVALEGRPEDYTSRLGEMIAANRVAVRILEEEEREGGRGENSGKRLDGPPKPEEHAHHGGRS
jgi:urease accessory protein